MKIPKWISENLPVRKEFLRASTKQLSDELYRLPGTLSSVYLWDKTLHCMEPGTSDERPCKEEVVVSLTSYGDRIHAVHLAIESIMQQTVKPNRIILWLAENEFKGKNLPVALRKQQERGLEIAFYEDLKSYMKLIPSLRRFPGACIITVDDDVAYHPDVVEKLIGMHIACPEDICATRIHRIVLGDDGKPVPYAKWHKNVEKCPEENNLAFFTGVGGVLYPPDCFPDEVMDKEVFLGSCATADDVWFNAMRVLKGTGVKKVFSVDYSDDFFELPVARVHSLRTNNVREGNDRAIMSVYGRYGLFPKLTQWHER